jgi:hypothetical protein
MGSREKKIEADIFYYQLVVMNSSKLSLRRSDRGIFNLPLCFCYVWYTLGYPIIFSRYTDARQFSTERGMMIREMRRLLKESFAVSAF